MRGRTEPNKNSGIWEPIQRKDMHSKVMKSLPFIWNSCSVRSCASVRLADLFVNSRTSAYCWSQSQLITLFHLAGWRPILPLSMRSIITTLLKIADVGIMRVVARCLHCVTHDVGTSYRIVRCGEVVKRYEGLTDAAPDDKTVHTKCRSISS